MRVRGGLVSRFEGGTEHPSEVPFRENLVVRGRGLYRVDVRGLVDGWLARGRSFGARLLLAILLHRRALFAWGVLRLRGLFLAAQRRTEEHDGRDDGFHVDHWISSGPGV